jgi:hypothetical protein
MSLKPAIPTMGNLVQASKDEWNAWTGGKPKPSWVGLEDSTATYESPNQLRSTYPSSAQKGYNYRKKGLVTKFSKKDDLALFQKLLLKHLVDCGMDSIAYLEDPADSMIMSNVIKEYAKFTLSTAQANMAHQIILYDKYDRENDRAAIEFLLDSLDTDLSTKLYERIEESDHFPIVWINLLKLVQSTSIERFENLRNRIKTRSASNYSGEDIELLAVDFRRDALELVTAGQYDHNLTLSMLKIFLMAGGANNGNYQFPLRLLKKDLNSALLVIPHMNRADADKFMLKENLTYKHICTLAEDEYRSQFDLDEWPPARHTKDSKVPPSGFANLAMPPNIAALTEARVLTLIHQAGAGSTEKKKGACHGCGSFDHWKRDCPQKKGQSTSWKTTPPSSTSTPSATVNGKPVYDHDHNGTKFQWCESCGRWSTTHHSGTHGHKAVESPAPASAHLAFSGPAAWRASFSTQDLFYDLWDIVGPHLTGFLLGAYLVGLKHFGAALLAPLLWGSILFAFFYFRNPLKGWHYVKDLLNDAVPNLPPPSRRESRRIARFKKNRRRRCHFRPGSIRDHGLHRQYPRKHRSNGHYYTQAPTVDDQALHTRIQRLHSLVLRLSADVLHLQNPGPQHSRRSAPATVREGDDVLLHAHACQPRRNKRAYNRKNRKAKYQPVPATGDLEVTAAPIATMTPLIKWPRTATCLMLASGKLLPFMQLSSA